MIRRPPRSPLFPYTTALPISRGPLCVGIDPHAPLLERWGLPDDPEGLARFTDTVVDALAGTVAVLKPQLAFYEDRKSTRLNSSHANISYAVFCLKKKNTRCNI